MMKAQEIDNIAFESLLYDFYGALLTDKQREVMELYHEENYSIVEIASELDISKQAVYDSLRKSDRTLRNYEEKLGLMRSLLETRDLIEAIDERIGDLMACSEKAGSHEITKGLKEIREMIARLDEG